MKIGIDGRILGLSEAGLGRYAQELVGHLLQVDRKNDYLLFVRREEKKRSTVKQSINLTIRETEIPHYSFKEQVLLPSFLSRDRCDLVHFPHFNVPLFYNQPYVVTIHDLIKHESRGLETTTRNPFVYGFKYLGYLLAIGLAARRAKKIIVPSHWVKKKVVAQLGVDPDKVAVIYEGVSEKLRKRKLSPGDKKDQDAEKTLKKYGIKKPYLLYVGSVYPHKNIDSAIKAVRKVNRLLNADRQPLATLVIVCARSIFWERLEAKIKKMKAESFVQLAGFVSEEDLAVFYRQAKAFVFPSLSEGFGLPGLEAMACGCPLVCSDIPVFKEIYGQAPFYFDPLEVDDIAQKVLAVFWLSASERRRRVRQGMERASQFSWEKCAQETLKVYQEVGQP